MIFNSKQLEELENIHDSTGAFEEEGDEEGFSDEVGEAAMDWRRGLIEEAAENIKRAKTRPVEPHLTYPIHSMLFDRDARRFARVARSIPGYLKIVYLSGGDREFGTLDVTSYLRETGASKRVSELAEQLGMSDTDVLAQLERLGITPIEEPEEVEATEQAEAAPEPPPAPVVARGRKPAAVEEVEELDEEDDDVEDLEDEEADEADDDAEVEASDDDGAEEELDDVGDDDDDARGSPRVKAGSTSKSSAKAPGKAAPIAKAAVAKGPPPKVAPAKASPPLAKPAVAKSAPVAKPVPVPAPRPPAAVAAKAPVAAAKGAGPAKPAKADVEKADAGKKGGKGGVDPIDNPNGYIKANFQEMSNRELARVTGLSEHTIRRKLGEWSLKRKKEA